MKGYRTDTEQVQEREQNRYRTDIEQILNGYETVVDHKKGKKRSLERKLQENAFFRTHVALASTCKLVIINSRSSDFCLARRS